MNLLFIHKSAAPNVLIQNIYLFYILYTIYYIIIVICINNNIYNICRLQYNVTKFEKILWRTAIRVLVDHNTYCSANVV